MCNELRILKEPERRGKFPRLECRKCSYPLSRLSNPNYLFY